MRTILFTAAVGLAAALLFVVQPMTTRGLLPLLGGSPSVWTTAMLFFQTALLAGYAWAHLIGARPGRRPVLVHAGLLAACAALLIARGWRHPLPGEADPRLWMLGELALAVGPGFFALASAGPLLQRWFARSQRHSPQHEQQHGTKRSARRDPYALFAASNLGSVIGLLGYPVLVEPFLGLDRQRSLWTIGYAIAAGLIVACGLVAARRGTESDATRTPASTLSETTQAASARTPTTVRTRASWVFLAFVPSSFMLGATAYLSTDVAAFPLLWIVPLTIYLATFVGAFAAPGRLPLAPISRYGGLALLFAAAAMILNAKHPLALVVALHLVALAAAGLVCHARLAALRLPPERLTGYYLWVAAGGALGGVFNALAAPVLFDSIAEYPIAVVLAALAGVRTDKADGGGLVAKISARWWALPLVCAGLAAVPLVFPMPAGIPGGGGPLASIAIGLALVIAATGVGRPACLAACLAVLFAIAGTGGGFGVSGSPRAIETERTERTFFGVHRVERLDATADTPAHRRLMHGTTIHGIALLDRPTLPTAYYHRWGPIGEVFGELQKSNKPNRPGEPGGPGGPGEELAVSAIGLGVGSIASYSRPGDRFTFFEIDPAVVDIATDPGLFRFVADAEGAVDIRVADGRLGIAEIPNGSLDLVVLDAFSSDSIPVHLLTAEAFETYLAKLATGGVLAVHLSNQHLDLAPVVGAIARELSIPARVLDQSAPPPGPAVDDLMSASVWALVARTEDAIADATATTWDPAPDDGRRAWTDDYADVLGVIRWDRPEPE